MGPGNKPNILQLIAGAEPLGAMRRAYDSAGRTVLLRDMVGGALSVYAAALIVRTGGTHVFVAEDRDAAAYLLNDFYALLDERHLGVRGAALATVLSQAVGAVWILRFLT